MTAERPPTLGGDPPPDVPPGVNYVGQPGWVHGHTLMPQALAEGQKWAGALLSNAVAWLWPRRGGGSNGHQPQTAKVGDYPELNVRSRGWLKLLWTISTTPDDWSSTGSPHDWWDKYSGPPCFNYPRFHLSECCYALLLMADRTPAWREVYTRVVDELVKRHITHWGAVDWLTQFGDDPTRSHYPLCWRGTLVPSGQWGKYNCPGWTANGVDPYGVQPDPIEADGMLFYKGFLNITMCSYVYVSGDNKKWNQSWFQRGVADKEYEWTHDKLAAHLNSQLVAHPEGVHCENTKIWPFCMSAACLSLTFSDQFTGRNDRQAGLNWLGYMAKNYCGHDKDGKVTTLPSYYDPELKLKVMEGTASNAGVAFYVLPNNPELARELYDAAVAEAYPDSALAYLRMIWGNAGVLLRAVRGVFLSGPLPWLLFAAVAAVGAGRSAAYYSSAPSPLWALLLAGLAAAAFWTTVKQLPPAVLYLLSLSSMSTRFDIFNLILATEFGDDATAAKLRPKLERKADPQDFGDGMFGFFFKLGEQYPRGQLSAMMMVTEVAAKGDWQRVFTTPKADHDARFTAPTVEGVDFPALGLSQATNDPSTGKLVVATYAATASRAGEATSFRVAQIPAAKGDVSVARDGASYAAWSWVDGVDGTIKIDTDIADHTFEIATGYTT